jgi:hypothetical protein
MCYLFCKQFRFMGPLRRRPVRCKFSAPTQMLRSCLRISPQTLTIIFPHSVFVMSHTGRRLATQRSPFRRLKPTKRNEAFQRRMAFSGTLLRAALVRNDISEELSASFIRVTRICELGITLAVTSNRISSQRASVASYSERFS